MTAATPPAMQPSGNAATEVEAASVVLRGAPLPVATRIGLWIGVQPVVAGLMIASGRYLPARRSMLRLAGGSSTPGSYPCVVAWLIRRQGHGISYRGLLGPPAALWQVGLGAFGVLAATVPAVVFSTEVTKAFYGDATLPMFALVDVPAWASVVAVLSYRCSPSWRSPSPTSAACCRGWNGVSAGPGWLPRQWSVSRGGEHAFAPFLTTDGGLDLVFVGYPRGLGVAFLALWTALDYTFGRRLLPIMVAKWVFNGGTALAVALNLV